MPHAKLEDALAYRATPEHKARRAVLRKRHADAIREYNKKWREANPDKVEAYAKSEARRQVVHRSNKKRRSTAAGAIHNRIGCQVYRALRSNKAGRNWPELLGYSVPELLAHIERQFTRGMSWERVIAGEIHIDHIVPLKSFSISDADDPELRRAWALTNLRPLWAAENLSKGARRETLL